MTKREKSPAFQWYPKDCDTDERVRAMDDREFGFYVRCLNHSWLNDGLPADLNEVARVLSRPNAYVRKIWQRVGRCFKDDGSGRLRNEKQEMERLKQAEFAESKRDAANARWEQVQSKKNARALRKQCPASASPSASATAFAKKASLGDWPLTHAAMSARFAGVDAGFLKKLVAKARKTNPDVSDELLSRAIAATYRPNQTSPGLWLSTVPEAVKGWQQRPLAVPNCAICQDTGVVRKPELQDVELTGANIDGAFIACDCRKAGAA